MSRRELASLGCKRKLKDDGEAFTPSYRGAQWWYDKLKAESTAGKRVEQDEAVRLPSEVESGTAIESAAHVTTSRKGVDDVVHGSANALNALDESLLE